jgi:thiamine biosynthesis protein ThiI
VQVRTLAGRLSLDAPDEVGWETLRDRVSSVFGVANFSRVHQSPPDAAALEVDVVREARARSFASFRVTTRRGWKGFPQRSAEIDRALGAAVHRSTGARVDLERPEMTLFVVVH